MTISPKQWFFCSNDAYFRAEQATLMEMMVGKPLHQILSYA